MEDVDQICAEARFSPGHLYHYFATREARIEAISGVGSPYALSCSEQLALGQRWIETLVEEIERLGNHSTEDSPGVLLNLLAEAGRNPTIPKMVRESSVGIESPDIAVARRSSALPRLI